MSVLTNPTNHSTAPGLHTGPIVVTAPQLHAASVRIQTLTQIDDEVCRQVQQYLARCAPSTGVCAEHDPRWLRILHNALQYEPHLIIARSTAQDDAPICGILPLAHVSSRLFGRFLVSLPYLNRAGVLADNSDIAYALIDHAVSLSEQLDVQYLELRHQESPFDHPQLTETRDEKVRMILPLPGDKDFLWKLLSSKVRNQVRKGGKSDLRITWGSVEQLDAFYDVFSVNMRDLGTPVFSRDLFAQILEQFPDQAELAIVRHGEQPIASALLIHDPVTGCQGQQTTQVPSASCLRAFNKTNANMWMYYHLLCRAIEKRSTAFDFGRSSVDSGTYQFKKQWGAQPVPTTWQYHLRHGDINAVRPDNPKYQRRIEMWQKLPVWVTRLIGPKIIRGIP